MSNQFQFPYKYKSVSIVILLLLYIGIPLAISVLMTMNGGLDYFPIIIFTMLGIIPANSHWKKSIKSQTDPIYSTCDYVFGNNIIGISLKDSCIYFNDTNDCVVLKLDFADIIDHGYETTTTTKKNSTSSYHDYYFTVRNHPKALYKTRLASSEELHGRLKTIFN